MVLSLDADFLCIGPGACAIRATSCRKRRVRDGNLEMNRLYVVESTPIADRRESRSSLALASVRGGAVRARVGGRFRRRARRRRTANGRSQSWFGALVKDLQAHKGASIVIAGENAKRGSACARVRDQRSAGQSGQDGFIHRSRGSCPRRSARVVEGALRAISDSGAVDVLMIVGGNPVFNAPADLDFADEATESPAARAPRPSRRRDLRVLPVAYPAGA